MPFYIDDPADPIERVREERARAARRVIDRTIPIGSEVQILKTMPVELALHEPRGIVVGCLPGPTMQVAVVCSMARGTEMQLTLLETDVRPV